MQVPLSVIPASWNTHRNGLGNSVNIPLWFWFNWIYTVFSAYLRWTRLTTVPIFTEFLVFFYQWTIQLYLQDLLTRLWSLYCTYNIKFIIIGDQQRTFSLKILKRVQKQQLFKLLLYSKSLTYEFNTLVNVSNVFIFKNTTLLEIRNIWAM
jgi:hypothetical protein